jgi:aminopeptidase
MMEFPPVSVIASQRYFPQFDLTRLLHTIFAPKAKEKICILIDLANPADVTHGAFLSDPACFSQKKAYEVFYQELKEGVMQELDLEVCDFFAYQMTGGSNLELPPTAMSLNGASYDFNRDIYPYYDIILCVSVYSATAPLTAAAKKFGFRGATLHGLNDTILNTGLAVNYLEVSRETERLRQAMNRADNMEIDFILEGTHYRLFVELGGQEAQKSHGLCHQGPDIVNLPAGEVYYVPLDAFGCFPMKFEDGTLAILKVEEGRVVEASLVHGDQTVINRFQEKLQVDPATGILGEIGFGTQILPFSGADIQDEKIFGTFHLALGRNDHLDGPVTLERFIHIENAVHEDILFSESKTPEIQVRQVRMEREGKIEVLIENGQPAEYLRNLIGDSALEMV